MECITEIDFLIDFHKDAERQGSGSKEDTERALSFINTEKNKKIKVADIGSGTGAQTMILAEHLNADISAVDLFPEFLEKLEINAVKNGLKHKISTIQKSMDESLFNNNELDLIWSEGAIYIIGFENGIRKWKDYLRVGGYLAVSEITWITDFRPIEIETFWNEQYPQIATASNKINILEENGFSPVGYFYLLESSWIDNYYRPIEDRMESFLDKHNHSDLAKGIIEAEKNEIRKYRSYKDFLSYGFYIAKKVR